MGAVLYLRISDDRDGTGLGVQRQEQDCRALCARQGWEVTDVLVDNDVSAYSGKRRPGYERLLDGLRAGSWDVVVAWHPDRLHRQPKELEGFIDVMESSGARVETVTAGTVDFSTPTGRAVARTVGAWARHSSEQAAERIRRKHLQIAEAGMDHGGGCRPFGFHEDRVTPHPVEAALIQHAATAVLDGMTIRSVAVAWDAQGVPTIQGGKWTTTVVRRILTSARIAGYREHAGRLYKAQWPAIIDEITWKRLRVLLLDPARRQNQSGRTYLLTGGLARCVLCEHRLVARPRSDSRRSYVCASGPGFNGCGKIRMLAEPFEEDVRRQVAAQIEEGHLPDVDPVNDVAHLLVEVEGLRTSMGELSTDYYADRTISKAQFQAASASLSDREAALLAQITRLERVRIAPVGTEALALLADPEPSLRQRAVVEALVLAVWVGSGVRGRNFYDPARVDVEFRV